MAQVWFHKQMAKDTIFYILFDLWGSKAFSRRFWCIQSNHSTHLRSDYRVWSEDQDANVIFPCFRFYGVCCSGRSNFYQHRHQHGRSSFGDKKVCRQVSTCKRPLHLRGPYGRMQGGVELNKVHLFSRTFVQNKITFFKLKHWLWRLWERTLFSHHIPAR